MERGEIQEVKRGEDQADKPGSHCGQDSVSIGEAKKSMLMR